MDYYMGALMLVAYNWAPRGWAVCNGQMLEIRQYTALFSLLGVNYGGNGTTNFALPNLPGPKDANGSPLTWIICLQGVFPQRD